MTRLRIVAARIRGLLAPGRLDRELADEIEAHLALSVEESLKRGMDPAEARREALRAFGGVERTKEAYRDVRGFPGIDALLQDLRLALRTLANSPGFTAVALLTLTLGIGASAAIFSVAYGVLHRPLPYRDPAALVLVSAKRDFAGERRPSTFSAFEIPDWSRRPRTLASLAGYSVCSHALEGKDGVEPLEGTYVSEQFFSTIGEAPARGRLLGPADDVSPVAVVSHRLWLRHFGGRPNAVGSTLTLNGRAYAVVGVAAPDFRFPSDRIDVWTPMGEAKRGDLAPWLNWPRGGGVALVARL
jgi:putative ABC transport system permease protein